MGRARSTRSNFSFRINSWRKPGNNATQWSCLPPLVNSLVEDVVSGEESRVKTLVRPGTALFCVYANWFCLLNISNSTSWWHGALQELWAFWVDWCTHPTSAKGEKKCNFAICIWGTAYYMSWHVTQYVWHARGSIQGCRPSISHSGTCTGQRLPCRLVFIS